MVWEAALRVWERSQVRAPGSLWDSSGYTCCSSQPYLPEPPKVAVGAEGAGCALLALVNAPRTFSSVFS